MDLPSEPIPDSIETVSPLDCWKLARKNSIRMIDVRTRHEFARAHAKYARNVPIDELDPTVFVREESASHYLICRGGTRSREAYSRVRAAVPTARVAVVDGGMLAWRDAGLPIVRSKPGRWWRLGRNAALAAVGVSILLAIFVNKALIGIAGLVGAVVVAVMMFDRRRWWLAADDDVRQG